MGLQITVEEMECFIPRHELTVFGKSKVITDADIRAAYNKVSETVDLLSPIMDAVRAYRLATDKDTARSEVKGLLTRYIAQVFGPVDLVAIDSRVNALVNALVNAVLRE